TFIDLFFCPWYKSRLISIFNSQNKFPPMMASIQIIKQCRAYTAEVKTACKTLRNANSYLSSQSHRCKISHFKNSKKSLYCTLLDMNQDKLYQYNNKQRWKFFLFVFAALIAAASLFYTNYLVKSLSRSERTKAEVWAMSTRSIMTMPDVDDQFISYVYAVRDSLSIPAIITDSDGNIIFWRDLDPNKTNIQEQVDSTNNDLEYDPGYFEKQLARMKRNHAPIALPLDTGETWSVYYLDSLALRQLRIFPYLQLSLIAIFLIIAYTVFNSIKKSEQNLVWVGMAKEAAHQLGTPISSLMGWLELVRIKFNAEDDS